MTTTTRMTFAEAVADALRAYEGSGGMYVGAEYRVVLPEGGVADVDLQVVDGAVRLARIKVLAWS